MLNRILHEAAHPSHEKEFYLPLHDDGGAPADEARLFTDKALFQAVKILNAQQFIRMNSFGL